VAFTRKYSLHRIPVGLSGGRFVVACFPFLLSFVTEVQGRQSEIQKSNLEVIQELVQQIGRSILSESRIPSGDTLSVSIDGGADSAIVQGALLQTIHESGRTAFLSGKSLPAKDYLLNVTSIHVHVHYDDPFTDGFLGSKKARRTISGRLLCQVIHTATNEVAYSGSPSREYVDTIHVADITQLERGVSPGGRGEFPPEGFLDRAIEPLIIIGATGVAIFLFFHVRS